jgi:hypothetical protein
MEIEMALQRIIAASLFLMAAVWGNAAIASPACDPRTLSMFYAAEKNAWDSEDFARLNKLNLENAKYADVCGHQKNALNPGTLLQQAANQYQAVGLVELGKRQYVLARKHLQRSNAIFHELQASRMAPQPDAINAAIRRNNDGLAKIPKEG